MSVGKPGSGGEHPLQLALGLTLDDDARLDNFYVSDDNRTLFNTLRQWLTAAESSDPMLFLSGCAGSGKSHLLQAACHELAELNLRTAYLPAEDLRAYEPAAVLEAMEHLDLVCLDDIESIMGNPAWEEAVFHWVNRCRASGTLILVSACVTPRLLELQLEDLRSRLSWGAVFQLSALDDEGLESMLQLRASARGLSLEEGVARYIVRRTARTSTQLTELLERLDQASLAAQRHLTQPFVKQVLEW